MSQRNLVSRTKKYALLFPAVAVGLAAAQKTLADNTPTLSGSAPAPTTSDLIALATDVGDASSGDIASAGLNNTEFFQNNGTSDPDDPVTLLAGVLDSNSQPLLLDLTAGSGGGSSVPTLSGDGSGALISQITTIGVMGDGQFDYVYNPNTGDVSVNYDGDTRITASNPLQRLKLLSASGMFNPNAVHDSAFNFEDKSNTLLDLSQTSSSIPDQYDIGNILPANLTNAQLANDLTLQFNVKGGGLGLKSADVVVPEPSTLGLIGLGAVGLLARRRKT